MGRTHPPSTTENLHKRFHTAAQYYLSGRPAYAEKLIEHVALLTGLRATHRIMDLGCGPGQLAVAFAPIVAEVVALDPEPAMLKIASDLARQRNVRVRFIEAGSGDLSLTLGRFRIVVIGRAFHWMDRPRTVERLNQLIEPEGAIVLFRDHHADVPENAWFSVYQELLNQYARDEAKRQRKSPNWLISETVLLDSPFDQLERIGVIERHSTPVETFVDRAFSMSRTSPDRLGKKADELAQKLRRLMTSYTVDGCVAEVIETEALIARRGR